jgi:hypothetical protein
MTQASQYIRGAKAAIPPLPPFTYKISNIYNGYTHTREQFLCADAMLHDESLARAETVVIINE